MTADLLREDVDMKIDICNMSELESSRFDAIICSHVLEHVKDDRKALAELFRIVKPGGFGLFLVPIIKSLTTTDEDPTVTDARERWRRFGQDDHVRLYAKSDFISRIEAAGFEVFEADKGYFGASRFKECGIAEESVLYVAKAPIDQHSVKSASQL